LHVKRGDWWRLATSLTLHQDLTHLGGNLLFGFLAIIGLNIYLGFGISWFLIIVSGIYGNMLNDIFYVTNHYSIGFSTAVFGALGLLTGLRLTKIHQDKDKKTIILISSLTIFTLLGTGGVNVDITAHVFGYLVGLILGLITVFTLYAETRISFPKQLIFYFCGWTMLILGWVVTFWVR